MTLKHRLTTYSVNSIGGGFPCGGGGGGGGGIGATEINVISYN